MKIKVEKIENKANEVKLEFTIEAEKFEKAMQDVYTKNAHYFNIQGFRKGKAPYKVVEKRYGAEIFYEDAFNKIAGEAYEEGIKENKLDVVSKPTIDIVQMEKGKELIFTAVVSLKPEVKLGKYEGIELKKIEYTVSDEDIEHELRHMAERNARLVTIQDRAVQDKDIVIIDFEGFVDGVPFEGGKAENHELTIGSKTFIPGFEDQIIGMKTGEEKEINVQFPKEYFSEKLSGKDAMFKVKLHEIKTKELPEINDDFAKDSSEFDTLAELKASIKEKKEKENENRAKYELEDNAILEVCKNAKIDIPEGMIKLEIDNMEKDFENRLSYQRMNLDKYLQMIGKTREEFRKEYKEQAEKQIKSRLVLDAIADSTKIVISEEEITEKIKEMAKTYGKEEDEIKNNIQLREYIEKELKSEKTIEYIVSHAKIK